MARIPNLGLSRWLLVISLVMPGTEHLFARSLTGADSGNAGTQPSQLAWESDHKKSEPAEDDRTAEFSFGVTNISDSEVVIDHVKASCSCTAAKLPSEPWHLAPHASGRVAVTVDLKDKMGEFDKTLTVLFADTNQPPKVLRVTVKMPDRRLMRARNLEIAKADRQAIFKGKCANCHSEPAKTASGMQLYHQICGVCHEARPRNPAVPDLRMIREHPTDVAFWKTNIANGKPGTMMPAFALGQGGPLTDEQIDALAKTIDDAYPYSRFAPPRGAGAAPAAPARQAVNSSQVSPGN